MCASGYVANDIVEHTMTMAVETILDVCFFKPTSVTIRVWALKGRANAETTIADCRTDPNSRFMPPRGLGADEPWPRFLTLWPADSRDRRPREFQPQLSDPGRQGKAKASWLLTKHSRWLNAIAILQTEYGSKYGYRQCHRLVVCHSIPGRSAEHGNSSEHRQHPTRAWTDSVHVPRMLFAIRLQIATVRHFLGLTGASIDSTGQATPGAPYS
ncbi:hypothetical protein V8C35DRAFT_141359 [Trichoderma chlorosporum]